MVLPPPTCVEMGAFYPVSGAMELTAEFGYATRRIPNHHLQYRPTPWHRRTGAPVRLTPPGTFVRTAIVTIGAGSGWGICAPTGIRAAAPGASCTVPRVKDTFWRPMARFSTANRLQSS